MQTPGGEPSQVIIHLSFSDRYQGVLLEVSGVSGLGWGSWSRGKGLSREGRGGDINRHSCADNLTSSSL